MGVISKHSREDGRPGGGINRPGRTKRKSERKRNFRLGDEEGHGGKDKLPDGRWSKLKKAREGGEITIRNYGGGRGKRAVHQPARLTIASCWEG